LKPENERIMSVSQDAKAGFDRSGKLRDFIQEQIIEREEET